MKRFFLCILALVAVGAAAAEFEAVVDDVVTAKVVSIKVTRGEIKPGQDCLVWRAGKPVGKLKIKTASGVCRVIEGRVQQGDQVRPAPAEEAAPPALDPDDDRKTTAEIQAEIKPPLRTMLEAEGALLTAAQACSRLRGKRRADFSEQLTEARSKLTALAAAERAYLGEDRRGRVAIALKDQGAPELANQVDPAAANDKSVLPFILPAAAQPFEPLPYGRLQLLQTSPALWALPQYWGRNPIDPVFSDISFADNAVTFGEKSEALVRRDIKLDDVEVVGQFKIKKGAFLYLILRSEVIVKFHHRHINTGVSVKAGYNNLSMTTTTGTAAPLDTARWYRFRARLVNRRLQVELDGKEVLSTTVSIDPSVGGAIPPNGYIGLGAHHAIGTFRNIEVRALSYAGRRTLPVFKTTTTYEKAGDPKDLLEDPKQFMSLFGSKAQKHLTGNHPVAKGILRIKGAPYSQFSVKGTDGNHFRVSGKVRMLEQGTTWVRANRHLLFGLLAKRKDRKQDAAETQVYYVKHSTGNFHSFDQAFRGTPLTPNQWYDWELEYHEPVGRFKLNGETIMVARAPADRGRDPGPNQIGLSAYNVKTEYRDLTFQRLQPKPPPQMASAAILQLFDKGRDKLRQAIVELSRSKRESGPVAAAILQGDRPPLAATVDDYITLADQLREKHNWPLALSILQANYERLPARSEERQRAESYWRKTQQKFEIAQEAVDLGEIGLDNLMKVGSRPAPMTNAGERGAVWMYIPGRERLQLFVPAKRESIRTIETDIRPSRLLDRGKWLLAVDRESKRILKLDLKTGKELGRLELPAGHILDWAAHPKAQKTYVCINKNPPNSFAVRQYKIYLLNEAEMSVEDTGGYGMRVSVDPHGRYVYSSFNFRITMNMRQISPEPLPLEMQRGGYIDHLVCFRIGGLELQQLSERQSPGADGKALAADPSGRLVCYASRGGFYKDRRREFLGQKVPAFRAGNVRTTMGAFDTGKNTKLLAFDPALPKLYAYSGVKVGVYSTQNFKNLDLIDLPSRIKPNLGETMLVTNDSGFLLFGFSGKSCGLYVHPLSRTTDPDQQWLADQLRRPAAELVADARKQIDADKTDAARRLLELVVQTRAFSAAGETAAGELLKLAHSPYLETTMPDLPLPAVDLTDLPNQPKMNEIKTPPAGRNVHRPATLKYGNREDYGQRVADLRSYVSLAQTYPMSWLWLCHRIDQDFPAAPDLALLAARELVQMKRAAAAETVAAQLLDMSEGSGWYAIKAYGIIADNAAKGGKPKREIAARLAALKLNPRNPLMHTSLGAAFRAAGAPHRADYHDLLSLYLFPSQPKLRDRLVKAGLAEPLPEPKEKSIEELYEEVSPSVVLIKQRVGVGTGFFITRDGLLLTNHHVIAGGEDVLKVRFTRKGEEKATTLPAQVVASNAQMDIAVLSVNLGELKIEPLMIGDAAPPKTGMKVIAIGNPGMGAEVLSRTVTEGIISNVRQKVGGQTYIQTSAAVNPGNSGGPLLNRNGRVIGMVTLKAHLDNVGFAIPTERLLDYLEQQLQ